jgi:hypothetical protein
VFFFCRDTLFLEDFKIKNILQDFKQKKELVDMGAQVLCYRCKDDGILHSILHIFIQFTLSGFVYGLNTK